MWMMELNYGTTFFRLPFLPERVAATVRAALPASVEEPCEIIGRALDSCSPSLATFKPGERVVIVTSDVTRYTGSELYLPLLVERLNAAGIRDDDIEVVIALGIHRCQTEHEHKKIMGPLHGRIRVSDHDCDDPGKLVFLGTTSNGIEVEVNRRVTEADQLILTGTIGFHYFAGFGGGRKSLLPGVASRKSCMASHFAVLNPGEGAGRNPHAATGVRPPPPSSSTRSSLRTSGSSPLSPATGGGRTWRGAGSTPNASPFPSSDWRSWWWSPAAVFPRTST